MCFLLVVLLQSKTCSPVQLPASNAQPQQIFSSGWFSTKLKLYGQFSMYMKYWIDLCMHQMLCNAKRSKNGITWIWYSLLEVGIGAEVFGLTQTIECPKSILLCLIIISLIFFCFNPFRWKYFEWLDTVWKLWK